MTCTSQPSSVLPISDEKYALELHFQEALISATICAREVKQECLDRHAFKVHVKREIGGPSSSHDQLPPTLRLVIKSEPKDHQETTELAKEKQWRRCPNCNFYVDKTSTQGCSHISCRCGFEFCYGCGVQWYSSHSCGIKEE